MRAAVIESGVVTNVILVEDGSFEVEGAQVIVSEVAAIGDQYVDGQFIKPEGSEVDQ